MEIAIVQQYYIRTIIQYHKATIGQCHITTVL